MSESGDGVRQSLLSGSNKQRTYSSFTEKKKKVSKGPGVECFVYELEGKETIQGLSIKYGVSTGEILRVNNLFSRDNIHLRKTLLIPKVASSPFSSTPKDTPSPSLSSDSISPAISKDIKGKDKVVERAEKVIPVTSRSPTGFLTSSPIVRPASLKDTDRMEDLDDEIHSL